MKQIDSSKWDGIVGIILKLCKLKCLIKRSILLENFVEILMI